MPRYPPKNPPPALPPVKKLVLVVLARMQTWQRLTRLRTLPAFIVSLAGFENSRVRSIVANQKLSEVA